MADFSLILIYFLYGLAFFSMGPVVALEGGCTNDLRLRRGRIPWPLLKVIYWRKTKSPTASCS
jgi:hypothetical protein